MTNYYSACIPLSYTKESGLWYEADPATVAFENQCSWPRHYYHGVKLGLPFQSWSHRHWRHPMYTACRKPLAPLLNCEWPLQEQSQGGPLLLPFVVQFWDLLFKSQNSIPFFIHLIRLGPLKQLNCCSNLQETLRLNNGLLFPYHSLCF